MNDPIQLTKAVSSVNSSLRRSPRDCGTRAFLLIPLAIACFALSPQARAICRGTCLTGDNTVLGDDALLNNTGLFNTAIGYNALFSNTVGGENTATGAFALYNTISEFNTGNGAFALYNNTSGAFNTAMGNFALYSNVGGSGIQGSYNTATGESALYGNTTGGVNTASGNNALSNNTTGSYNTAAGGDALYSNTTGFYNTANGHSALRLNTSGFWNTATGNNASYLNTTGSFNTATGTEALERNKVGRYNIAVGFRAGELIKDSNNIDIGNGGDGADSGTIRIGTLGRQTSAYVAGISEVTVPQGVGVIIDTDGHLGTVVSSARFKDSIKPMDKASEAILALEPVTFHYKKDLDPDGIPQFGLVAEQVEKVNPDLVARDNEGRPYTVRYEAVNAMLLNEFLKEHRKVEDLQASVEQRQKEFRATVAQQQKEITALTAGLKAQAVQIQKVNEQLQTAKSAPRLASNQE